MHYSSGSLIPALLSDLQPITCHNIKDVSNSGALCLRLNESHTCVSGSPSFAMGRHTGGGEQQGGVLQHSQSGGDGTTVLAVSLGWGALHFHP